MTLNNTNNMIIISMQNVSCKIAAQRDPHSDSLSGSYRG